MNPAATTEALFKHDWKKKKEFLGMLISPSFFSHLTMFPSSMVGERAGICTLTELTPRGEKENRFSKEVTFLWFSVQVIVVF